MIYILNSNSYHFRDDDSYGKTLEIMKNIKIVNPSLIDCANVRYICESVSKRSAYLVSAGLAALLNKINSKISIIGVDGSLYRYHPYFKEHLKKMTRILTKPDIEVKAIISFQIYDLLKSIIYVIENIITPIFNKI